MSKSLPDSKRSLKIATTTDMLAPSGVNVHVPEHNGHEDVNGDVYATLDKPTTLRLNIALQRKLTAYCKAQGISKGPTLDALVGLLLDGAIDLATVKAAIRARREDD